MLKKLKSLFIEEDETGEDQKKDGQGSNKEKQNPNANPSAEALPSKEQASQMGAEGQAEEKFVNRLLSALEENNLKGFDYLEYKQALQNLSTVDMDEPTRYKSALAMATTMGATPPNLIKSAQHYLKVLKEEEVKFIDAFKNQQTRLVKTQEQELVDLKKVIDTKQQQVEKLTKEIEAHKKNLEGRKNQANQATAKVQSTKENFYASYNIVVDQIADDIKKMTDYLQ